MTRILIVEDEPSMLAGLKDNLEIEGYAVDTAENGTIALKKLLEHSYHLVLLDVMLPELSGFDVLKQARERGLRTPVIMLTAKGEEVDRVVGLELGADDYVTKPFSLRELLARVKAVLRRADVSSDPDTVMTLGSLTVDFNSYNASRDGTSIEMTPREFEVLRFLWQHRNRTVSRDQLLTSVWGYDEPMSTRTVDNFILRLRQKVEEEPAHPRHILTIHGTGYKLIP